MSDLWLSIINIPRLSLEYRGKLEAAKLGFLSVGVPSCRFRNGFVCFWTNMERLRSVLGQSYHLDQKTEQLELQPKIRYVPEENARLA